jgi:hypothetical protein
MIEWLSQPVTLPLWAIFLLAAYTPSRLIKAYNGLARLRNRDTDSND